MEILNFFVSRLAKTLGLVAMSNKSLFFFAIKLPAKTVLSVIVGQRAIDSTVGDALQPGLHRRNCLDFQLFICGLHFS